MNSNNLRWKKPITAEFNSLVKEDARADAEFLLSESENHSREQHHLPIAARADMGKERMFFLTVELSQRMRRLIVDEHSPGMGYRQISSKYNIHVSTIRAIIQRWKRYGVVTNLPRKGRPRKLH